MSAKFHPLTISDIVRETPEAISVLFDMPSTLASQFVFSAGQHLALRADIDGEDVRRSYSLCSAPAEGKWQVAIKMVSGGAFSTWANQSLKVGDVVDAMPPHGSFTHEFDPSRSAHYVGIAAGSGITPILSLLKTALAEEPLSRFTLIYGNHDCQSSLFLETLQQLKNRHMGRLSLINVLSAELDEFDILNGRLDRSKCATLFDTLGDLGSVRAFFICGPGPVMDAAEAELLERGVAADHILVERFTADRPSASEAAAFEEESQKASGTQMRVTLDGRTRMVSFNAEVGNILDSARLGGLAAPYACKAGVCATCRAKLISGNVKMAARFGLSDDDLAKGYILTCQAIPTSDDLVVDFDQ